MDIRNSPSAAENGRAIFVTRAFDAPRERIFDAWTDPRQLVRWWGPDGFATTTHAIDVRPGGDWRFVTHGPDGADYEDRIVYHEIAKPDRLVYSHPGDEGVEPAQFQVTVTFDDFAGVTNLTMTMLFPSAAERERAAAKYGAVEGAKQTLKRLAIYLAGIDLPHCPSASEPMKLASPVNYSEHP
ncbi:MAG: SRPBCC family protein [Beijerinckiaceae bacterium]|nr:SRPBCC family protein [Beijerinckiaceae bacterium]MCI0734674.1 SRPBCC family protein [Beijerinckiaceae bacterium]